MFDIIILIFTVILLQIMLSVAIFFWDKGPTKNG